MREKTDKKIEITYNNAHFLNLRKMTGIQWDHLEIFISFFTYVPCVTNERTKDIKSQKREINYILLNTVENIYTYFGGDKCE